MIWGRKDLIAAGMWAQAAVLFLIALTRDFRWWLLACVLLGLGIAMVYPSLIAAVLDTAHPSWRSRALREVHAHSFDDDWGSSLGGGWDVSSLHKNASMLGRARPRSLRSQASYSSQIVVHRRRRPLSGLMATAPAQAEAVRECLHTESGASADRDVDHDAAGAGRSHRTDIVPLGLR